MGSRSSKDAVENGDGCDNDLCDVVTLPKSKNLLLDEFDNHEDSINYIALSDDGSLLVTGGDDCVARMWSTKTPVSECLGEFMGHSSYITCIAIVDTFVVTGSADTTIRKWDMTNCDCLFVYEGHTSRICRLICTSEFIFSSSYDKTARIWLFNADKMQNDKENKACVGILQGHTKAIYPLVYIPANGMPTEVDVNVNHVDINPGDVLITGSADCTARSWSVSTKGCLKVFHGHTKPIMCMAADDMGTTLFTAGGDNFILSWNLKTATVLKEYNDHSGAVIGIQVVNRLMYTASSDQTVKAWVIEFGDCTRTFTGHNHSVTYFKFAEGYVITGCGDGIVRVFDAKSGHLRQEYKGHNGAVTALAIVDKRLYTTCVDGKLRVWNAEHLIGNTKRVKDQALDDNQTKVQELEKHFEKFQINETKMPQNDADIVKETGLNKLSGSILTNNNIAPPKVGNFTGSNLIPSTPGQIPGAVDQALEKGKGITELISNNGVQALKNVV